MKPLVIVIIVLVVLALLFVTGVGVGVAGVGGKADPDHSSWGVVADAFAARRALRLDEVGSRGGRVAADGLLTAQGTSMTLTFSEVAWPPMRLARLVVERGTVAAKFTRAEGDENSFEFSKQLAGGKSLKLSVPKQGGTLDITLIGATQVRIVPVDPE